MFLEIFSQKLKLYTIGPFIKDTASPYLEWICIVQIYLAQNFFKPHFSSPIYRHYASFFFKLGIQFSKISTDLLSTCIVQF